MFFKGLKEVGGNARLKLKPFVKISKSLSLQKWDRKDRELAAKYTREGQGHANEGWFVEKDVRRYAQISTTFFLRWW